jgi:putative peptidoglycan lipid II flippase
MTDQATPQTSSTRVAKSTLIVMGGLLAALVTGLIRQRIIAGQFGTTAPMDAFTAADELPELLFIMLASVGTLGFAFIPIYTEFLTKNDKAGADRLASQVVNTILILALVVAAIAALLAPTIVTAPWGLGPHFPESVQVLTIELVRLLLISTIIFAISGLITAVLQSNQHFILPALSPTARNFGVIFGAVVLAPSMMAQISIGWLNANIASGLGEGRLSSLGYAFRLMNMPWTLIGTAIGIAVFPTLATLAARHDVKAQRNALSGSLRAILTLTLPAAVGLLLLGRPIIQVLFEGGEFTSDSTDLVFFALQFYVIALISQSVLEVVVRAFASRQDTLTPLLISFFTTALNIGLAIWLATPERLSTGGLALANGVAVGIEALIGLTIIQRRWGIVRVRQVLLDLGRALAATLTMAIVIWVALSVLPAIPILQLIIAGGLGTATYVVTAYLLGIEEIVSLPKALLRGMARPRAAEA